MIENPMILEHSPGLAGWSDSTERIQDVADVDAARAQRQLVLAGSASTDNDFINPEVLMLDSRLSDNAFRVASPHLQDFCFHDGFPDPSFMEQLLTSTAEPGHWTAAAPSLDYDPLLEPTLHYAGRQGFTACDDGFCDTLPQPFDSDEAVPHREGTVDTGFLMSRAPDAFFEMFPYPPSGEPMNKGGNPVDFSDDPVLALGEGAALSVENTTSTRQEQGQFSCQDPSCNNTTTFRRLAELRRHVREQHEQRRTLCGACGSEFKRAHRFREHYRRNHAMSEAVEASVAGT